MLPLLLLILLVIVLLFNTILLFKTNESIRVKTEETSAGVKLPKIMLIGINVKDCSDCYDINGGISGIEKLAVNITSKDIIDWNDKNAKDLIQKYDIKQVPTLLVFGEINSSSLTAFWADYGEKVKDALVLTKPSPVYYDVGTGKEVGRVDVIYLNASNCVFCVDRSRTIPDLETVGIKFRNIIKMDVDSPEGVNLIDKYNLSFAPTLIFSNDISAYQIINLNWGRIGSVEKDGAYVWRSMAIPYYDIKQMKVRGLVSLTYLSDKTCGACYNVSIHKQILTNPSGLSLKVINETSYDISDTEGKKLVAKYKITEVPTSIITGDTSAYAQLTLVWPQVGTIESDGSYIFRNVSILNMVYKDLSTGKIVNASATGAT